MANKRKEGASSSETERERRSAKRLQPENGMQQATNAPKQATRTQRKRFKPAKRDLKLKPSPSRTHGWQGEDVVNVSHACHCKATEPKNAREVSQVAVPMASLWPPHPHGPHGIRRRPPRQPQSSMQLCSGGKPHAHPTKSMARRLSSTNFGFTQAFMALRRSSRVRGMQPVAKALAKSTVLSALRLPS